MCVTPEPFTILLHEYLYMSPDRRYPKCSQSRDQRLLSHPTKTMNLGAISFEEEEEIYIRCCVPTMVNGGPIKAIIKPGIGDNDPRNPRLCNWSTWEDPQRNHYMTIDTLEATRCSLPLAGQSRLVSMLFVGLKSLGVISLVYPVRSKKPIHHPGDAFRIPKHVLQMVRNISWT
jgi:hypothetical protein